MLCFICFIAFSLCSEIEIVMMPIDFKCFIALVKVQLAAIRPRPLLNITLVSHLNCRKYQDVKSQLKIFQHNKVFAMTGVSVDVLINILVVCRVRLSANRIVVTPEVGCKQSFKNLFVYLIKTDQSVHVLLSHHLSLSFN